MKIISKPGTRLAGESIALIHGQTGVRFGESGNTLEAANGKACNAIQKTTIGED